MTTTPLQPEVCARLLAALAAPERLRIVRFLAAGPRTVTEITEMLGVPANNVPHHLAVLKQADLVRTRRAGRFVYYSLREGLVAPAGGCPAVALDLAGVRLLLPTDGPPRPGAETTPPDGNSSGGDETGPPPAQPT